MKKFIISVTSAMATCIAMMSTAIAETETKSYPPLVCQINYEIPSIQGEARTLNPKVLDLALTAYYCAKKMGYNDPRQMLSIIDYTFPSTERRLWVIDLKTRQILFNTLVAQGKNTGEIEAKYFSNVPESKESSIGVFLTDGTFEGNDGYSLRIIGLDPGFNTEAEAREVVIHGAWYVSKRFVKEHGYLGRSWGCPAVSKRVITPLIDDVKMGTILVSYYPNPKWLAESKFLHCGQKFSRDYLRSFSWSKYPHNTAGT